MDSSARAGRDAASPSGPSNPYSFATRRAASDADVVGFLDGSFGRAARFVGDDAIVDWNPFESLVERIPRLDPAHPLDELFNPKVGVGDVLVEGMDDHVQRSVSPSG